MNKIYLAGPITSCSFQGANDWREGVKQELKNEFGDKIKVLSPMRGKHYLKDCKEISATGNEKLGIISGGPAILARDYSDATTSDMILVNLLGAEKVSIGSMFEIAWAYQNHIPVVLVIEDDTQNIHSHSMFFAMCGYRVNNLHDALIIVKSFFDF